MIKLKPCPFCGKEVKIKVTHDDHYVIECDKCNSSTSFPYLYSREDIINAWNNRPDPWRTGVPTEEGAYLIKLESQDREVAYTIMPMEAVICGNKLHMKNDELSIVAWQKIEDKENGKE